MARKVKTEEQESQDNGVMNLDALSELAKRLNAECRELELRKNNLEVQNEDLQKRLESDDNGRKAMLQKERTALIVGLSKDKAAAEQAREQAERLLAEAHKRKQDIAEYEAQLKPMDVEMENLRKEKQTVYQAKRDAVAEQEKAMELMAEAQGLMEAVDQEKQNLASRSEALKKVELDWNNRIGEVEAREKELAKKLDEVNALLNKE